MFNSRLMIRMVFTRRANAPTLLSRTLYTPGIKPSNGSGQRGCVPSWVKLGLSIGMTSYILSQWRAYSESSRQELDDWRNKDNLAFYKHAELDAFRRKAGLSSSRDLALSYHYFFGNKNKKNMKTLVVGANGGREVEHLLAHDFAEKNLTLVEVVKNYSMALKKQYPQAKVLPIDVKKLTSKNIFDAIFWMFSGIADFSKDEQKKLIALLLCSLNENGTLVIDIPVNTNATEIKGRHHVIETETNTYVGYLPSDIEMHQYLQTIADETKEELHLRQVSYKTSSSRVRKLLGISKRSLSGYTFSPVNSSVELERKFEPTR